MQLSSNEANCNLKVKSRALTSRIRYFIAFVLANISIALGSTAVLHAELITVNFQGVASYQALDASQNGQFVNISSIMPFASGTAYTGIWTYDSTNGQGTLQHNVGGTRIDLETLMEIQTHRKITAFQNSLHGEMQRQPVSSTTRYAWKDAR